MVASLHTITHSRPSMRPMPVMIPAAWISPSYMPLAASGDSSRKGEPGSTSRSTRSRRPAARGLGAARLQLVHERAHGVPVGAEFLRMRIHGGADDGHALPPSRGSHPSQGSHYAHA